MSDFVIENGVLTKYTGPGGDVVIPEGVTTIDSFSFYGCTSLVSIQIPGSVVEINESAFSGCSGLKSIHLPEGVEWLGWEAFADCESLTEIHLPKSLMRITNGIFRNTGWLNKESKKKQPEVILDGVLVKVSSSIAGAYAVPDGVRLIAPEAFDKCSKITGITIPESVAFIGQDAFCGRKALHSIFNYGSAPALCEVNKLVALYDGYFPHEDLSCLETWQKRIAAECYLKHREMYGEADHNQYADYLKKHGPKLMLSYVKEGNAQIAAELARFVPYKAQIAEEALSVATGNVELTAILMEYQNRSGKAEKNAEPALSASTPTAQELKQLWGTKKNPDGSLTITNYKGREACVIVPEKIGKSSITAIGKTAFSPYSSFKGNEDWRREGITEVVLPEGVSNIAYDSFDGCRALVSLTIPASVKSPWLRVWNQNVLTIHAPSGSDAEKYAQKNNISFETI